MIDSVITRVTISTSKSKIKKAYKKIDKMIKLGFTLEQTEIREKVVYPDGEFTAILTKLEQFK